ncbi:hypothetical protein M426DRAFT_324801 [Hypoxylon sp. CI-4A]|nr:hypothetical protein M426DRAFT_324801 [Hypoxylon sp. CI-4A]
MVAVSVFRARYTDETSLYDNLRKIFPTGIIQIRFQRGRFQCTIPRTLTPEEAENVHLAIEKEHYER